MTKKVFYRNLQPDPEGPVFGYVFDAAEFQKTQEFLHAHVETVVKDLLMSGAVSAVVSGFAATPGSGLSVNVAAGQVHAVDGKTHGSDAVTVALSAAHATLPRIDLIYATLSTDAEALTQFRPFRQLRTLSQLSADPPAPPYPPIQENVSTELHTRATVLVRAGTPNASPVAPALNAGEVPLFQIAVAANATTLISGNITSVHNTARSLAQALTDISTLLAFMAGANATYVNTTGDTMTGPLNLPSAGLQVGSGGVNQFRVDPNTGYVGINALFDTLFETKIGGTLLLAYFARMVGAHPQLQFFDTNLAAPAGRYYVVAGTVDNLDKLRFGRFVNEALTAQQDSIVIKGNSDVDILTNLSVLGTITGGVKYFQDDHPLDPDNKNLRYAAIEGPRHDLLFRGKAVIPDGETGVLVNIDTASNQAAGTFVALVHDSNVQICLQNETTFEPVKALYNNNGTLSILRENDTGAITISWLLVAENNSAYLNSLPTVDGDGHLIVEEDKPAGDSDLLVPREESVAAVDAAPDEDYEEIVTELIGTAGYPLHAIQTGEGAVPTRTVTRHITDQQGNSYEPPEEP
ncbi:MAG: hypothetical protein QOF02_244 [Blastocatellia bacterium]|jgi:hypothetical protein|nr:hypothetical protein [Blastocatellia bacterium]